MRSWWKALPVASLALAAGLAACSDKSSSPGALVPAPTNLRYRLEASGDPSQPSGILLEWDGTAGADLKVWNIYSRGSTSGSYHLRGSTTSRSFDDRGVPDLQYYVTAEDVNGNETDGSNIVRIDERLRMQSPSTLASTTLNGAIALAWSDNPFSNAPNDFSAYRIYSTSYDLDNDRCGATWSLEGTTVAPEFIVSALTNGVSRCFGVSAVSVQGDESLWSPLRNDTPRPDARNVVVFARQAQSTGSAFRFFFDLNGDGTAQANELGLLLANGDPAADFLIDRDGSGDLFLTPVRSGTQVTEYGAVPSDDLTSIDVAPVTGYSTVPIKAVPGWGYVFQMSGGDGFARYGAVRITHVGQNFLILDWAFQTDPGNPELNVGRR